jgi:alkylhydroperoxidase/carboxymuconolactone decarboxylase family protein YurZ
MDDARYERGLARRRDVLGPERGDAPDFEAMHPSIAVWRRYLIEEGWGGVWDRGGISPKTRSLVSVVALALNGHQEELRLHLVGAMRNGWLPAELTEILIHLSSYGGYPPVVAAFRIAEQVFAEEVIVGSAHGRAD